MEKVGETVRGEDLKGANATEVTPVVAVRRGSDRCVVVSDVLSG